MSLRPVLSIIIVSFRTPDILRDCLRSLQAEVDLPREVVVVDNASGDDTVAMVRSEFPEVMLIDSAINLGFSPANNLALERATGEYLLLLNPDTVVRRGALASWLEAHRSVGAGISGPNLLNTDGSLQVSAWKVPGLLDSVLELFYLHRWSGAGAYPRDRFDTDFRPAFVSGAAMLFHRKVYERVGGLDPTMFWMEDVDLCVRVRQEGGSCWYFHQPEIIHIGGQSAKQNPVRAISNQLLSRIKFARKHEGPLSAAVLSIVVLLHILTRMTAFAIIAWVRPEPRAQAYRHTLVKWWRYLFHGDRTI
jgi:N-acetylglucosaminyl-diphospho-decaprenol L-rhamnosyltransferase